MHLADTCRSEGIKIDLFKLLLPLRSVGFLKDADHLLNWHDVSFGSSLLHSIAENRRQHTLFRGGQNLANFEGGSTHFSKTLSQSICVALVEGKLCDSTLALLVILLLRETDFLLDCLCDGTADELCSEHAEMEDS